VDELSGFDRPVFKQLSHNDSGASVGHQGGILIPKEFDAYFPQLSGKISPSNPTVGEDIKAILFVGEEHVANVTASYRYQSWGGGRPVERRITNNLGPMRSKSVKGDIVLIERNLEDRYVFRLTLVKQGTDRHKAILKVAGGKPWGLLNPLDPPVSEKQIESAEKEQKDHENKSFDLFDNDAALTETRTRRIARSRAFQKLTTDYYDGKCAVCGRGFVALNGKTEVEAAHIVPRGMKGADDARNGLALCRSHHWAFDRGLWSVKPKGEIVVATAALGKGSNDRLKRFAGKTLTAPTPTKMAPSVKALAWHHANVFGR
jgi:putative restriction endonuclease